LRYLDVAAKAGVVAGSFSANLGFAVTEVPPSLVDTRLEPMTIKRYEGWRL